MDAILFDFDGIVIDSEPVHFEGFRQVLETAGITLTREDYYAKYLGYDDHDGFLAVARDNGLVFDETKVAELTAAKTHLVQQMLASVPPLPGAVELIRAGAEAGVPMAVCSGALRAEVEGPCRALGIAGHFAAIVAAEDVDAGKPDPQGYRLARERLAEATGHRITAARCLAVEDSPAGIDAARAAGMRVLAVTTSYPAETLAGAERIEASLADVSLEMLEGLL